MLNINILNINPEIVCNIILKAKEFQAKEGVTFPEPLKESEYEYDWSQILADHADDLTVLEIQDLIEDLELDQKIDLLTLMYVGRGDFDIDDWAIARRTAKDNLQPQLSRYLLSKPLIADHLSKGLELLGYSCDE